MSQHCREPALSDQRLTVALQLGLQAADHAVGLQAPAQSEEVAAGNITQGEADLMAKYGGGTDDVYTGDDGQDAE